MGREIKFRAWDKKAGCYWAGYLLEQFAGFNNQWEIVEKSGKADIIFEQYTGLKDKNGMEIYEGDILTPVSYLHADSKAWLSMKLEAIFYRGMFCFKLNGEFVTEYKPLYKSIKAANAANNCYVVIGNIHENPELLNG